MTHFRFEIRPFLKLLLGFYCCITLLGIFSVEDVKPERYLRACLCALARVRHAGSTDSSGKLTVTSG